MERAIISFNRLSAKQIKTNTAIILMVTLSFEAFALAIVEEIRSEPSMGAIIEASYEEELYIENWMLTPFEISINEETAMEILVSTPSEELIELEVAVESWMTMPFETDFVDESPTDSFICSPVQ